MALVAGALQTTSKGRSRIDALVKKIGIKIPELPDGDEA
jgi:hypothetical protein